LIWLDMAINFKKSCCMRIGPRCDTACANVCSITGYVLAWVTELRYLGRIASEDVTLQLLSSKCIPLLLYGLESFPLSSSQLESLDFTINRFFMKLFRTNNIDTVKTCQYEFGFKLPTTLLACRKEKFCVKLISVIIICYVCSVRLLRLVTALCVCIVCSCLHFLIKSTLLLACIFYHSW